MALLSREPLERLIDELGLADRRDTILSVVRNSIRATVTDPFKDDSALPTGTSKIGGLPDLASGAAWPQWNSKALSFVAQINLVDIAPYDVDSLLPKHGLISFFYNGCQWIEGEPFEPGMWHVAYYDGSSSSLHRLSAPSDFGEYNGLYSSCALAFSHEITLPPWESFYGIKVLGFTYEHGQGDVFWEAHDARHGKSLRDHSVRPYDDLASGIADWLLLFQLDSEDKAGMMWGDVGRLYYCIQRADLAAGAFHKAICTMQCS